MRDRRLRALLAGLVVVGGLGPAAELPAAAVPVDTPGDVRGHPDTSEGFVAPVPPVVVVPFDPPEHRYGPGHRGVDLAAAEGTVVRAAGSGTVVYAGHLVDRGVVSIQHAGGIRTTYEPVLAAVRAGEYVRVGQVIGTVTAGHRRCLPRPCLHWGVRMPDAFYLDPMALLRPWQVRLKPWAA